MTNGKQIQNGVQPGTIGFLFFFCFCSLSGRDIARLTVPAPTTQEKTRVQRATMTMVHWALVKRPYPPNPSTKPRSTSDKQLGAN